MPTYEYACRDCGEHLEVVQSFHDDPLTVCPACDGELRKVFSAAGIVFKGSGWHIKDYGTSTSSSRAPEPSKADGETSGSSTTDPGSSGEKEASGDGGSDADRKSA